MLAAPSNAVRRRSAPSAAGDARRSVRTVRLPRRLRCSTSRDPRRGDRPPAGPPTSELAPSRGGIAEGVAALQRRTGSLHGDDGPARGGLTGRVTPRRHPRRTPSAGLSRDPVDLLDGAVRALRRSAGASDCGTTTARRATWTYRGARPAQPASPRGDCGTRSASQPGDRILTWSPSTPELPAAYFGAMRAGLDPRPARPADVARRGRAVVARGSGARHLILGTGRDAPGSRATAGLDALPDDARLDADRGRARTTRSRRTGEAQVAALADPPATGRRLRARLHLGHDRQPRRA